MSVHKLTGVHFRRLGTLSHTQFHAAIEDLAKAYHAPDPTDAPGNRLPSTAAGADGDGAAAFSRAVEDRRRAEAVKTSLLEVLWETKRLARDISSNWWRQMRERNKIEQRLNSKVDLQRNKALHTSEVLDSLASRAAQLLDHIKEKRAVTIQEEQHDNIEGAGPGTETEAAAGKDPHRENPFFSLEDHEAATAAAAAAAAGDAGLPETEAEKQRRDRHARRMSKLKTQAEIEAEAKHADDHAISLAISLGKTVHIDLDKEIEAAQRHRVVQLVSKGVQTDLTGRVRAVRGGKRAHGAAGLHHHHHKELHRKDGVSGTQGDGDNHQDYARGVEGLAGGGASGRKMGKLSRLVKGKLGTGSGDGGVVDALGSAAATPVQEKQKAVLSSLFGKKFGNPRGARGGGGASFLGLLRALGKFKRKSTQRIPAQRAVMTSILEIYLSKIPIDEQSDRDGVPRLDFSKFCYNFYYRRFGLRKLAEQHLVGLNAAFKKYRHTSPRIFLFARFCGVFGRLDKDCLDFVMLLIATVQQRDAPALEPLEVRLSPDST